MPFVFADPFSNRADRRARSFRGARVGALMGLVLPALVVASAGTGCRRSEPQQAAQVPPPPTARPDHPVPEAPVEIVSAAAEEGPGLSSEERASLPGLIAFVREIDHRKVPHVVRPDGSGLRALPSPHGLDAVVMAASRDGRYLAGVAAAGEGEEHVEQLVLWTLPELTMREVGPKSRRARHPVFSPDGTKLAFESGHERFSNLYVAELSQDAAGAVTVRRVTDAEAGDFEPSWSNDGAWLTFASSREGDPEIFRVRADGSELQRLTAFHREDVSPRWSPTGAQIAFLSDRAGDDALYLMAADGTGQRRVGPEGAAREHVWSPDGTRLALAVKAQGGRARVATVEAKDGRVQLLTGGDAVEDMPAFSPDGRHLVFVSDRGGPPGLHLIRADGSGRTPLFAATGSAGAAHDWLPLWFAGSRAPNE